MTDVITLSRKRVQRQHTCQSFNFFLSSTDTFIYWCSYLLLWTENHSRLSRLLCVYSAAHYLHIERLDAVKSISVWDSWPHTPPESPSLLKTPCAMWGWRRTAGRVTCTDPPPSMCRCSGLEVEIMDLLYMSSLSITGEGRSLTPGSEKNKSLSCQRTLYIKINDYTVIHNR